MVTGAKLGLCATQSVSEGLDESGVIGLKSAFWDFIGEKCEPGTVAAAAKGRERKGAEICDGAAGWIRNGRLDGFEASIRKRSERPAPQ